MERGAEKFLSRDRWLYRTYFPLLLVISLQQLAALSVNLVDNLMLGQYTELALSGATIVNQIQFLLQMVVNGIGMGVTVLGSQYWGKQDISPIRRIISLGFRFSIVIGVLFFLITFLFPYPVLSIFTDETAVVYEGVRYLKIMCWTYIIFAVSNTLMYSLRSVEIAFIGTVMSCSTLCINLFLNYCLIFGNLGFPELGIAGAGIATLISRCVELLIVLIYIFRIDRRLNLKLTDLLSLDNTYLKDFNSAALPVMISGFLWGIGQAAQMVILGHMGETVIAANSIAIVIFQIFYIVGSSSGSASQVTIGKAVGEGKMQAIREYSRTLQMIFLICGVIQALFLYAFSGQIVAFYDVSEETKELTLKFLHILCITLIGSSYEYPVQSGIIAGGGDPKYQVLIDNLFIWLFTLPFSAAAAFLFQASPVVVFWFLKLDQVIKCLPNAIKCNRYKWVKILTRD